MFNNKNMNMKITFTIVVAILFFAQTTHSQNYYVSSSASTSGNGTINSPWNSFSPLNALLASTSSIDTIFLKNGDTFRDQIIISNNSGFVITSYGTGNKPIISGAELVSTWTAVPNTSYWQANFNQRVVNFFANDKEQILARYPDENSPYLTVDAGTSNDTLIDAALNFIPSNILNKSQICVHTAQWCWEKSPILSSTNNSIIYLNPTLRVPTPNYGYFLYDHLSYLTTGKEWKYDSTSQKIYYQPTSGDPNQLNCEASVRNYGILLNAGIKNVEIKNIAFEKQIESAIAILDSTNQNIKVDNCNFARQYKYGINIQGKLIEVSNNYFREVDGLAIYLNGGCSKSEIHHNVFRNNGGYRNSGIGLEINLSSIKSAFIDSCHIHHNDIDSAGYCGISIDGRWNIIERNIVKNAMLINNDGAALKSFGVGSQYNIFRNNFVSKSNGNIEGVPVGQPESYFPTPAIYFDYSTNHCTIQENTIYDQIKKGIFLNASSNNNSVIGNVVYGSNYLLDFNGAPNSSIFFYVNMTGMTVKRNVLFAKDASSYIIRMVDNTGGYNHGLVDSNYYFQPYNVNNFEFVPPSTVNNYATWLLNSGYDIHSKSNFTNWTLPINRDTLFMNPTDNIVSIDLGLDEYLDLDSNIVCGNITLQPYTSKILIRTQNTCTISSTNNTIQNNLKVYPNPSSERVAIQSEQLLTSATLTVYNLHGQIMKEIKDINGYIINFERENLISGVYILNLSQGNKTIGIHKIIISDF